MTLNGLATTKLNFRDMHRSLRQLFRRSFLSLKPTYPEVGLEISQHQLSLARLERQKEGKAILRQIAQEPLPEGAVELSFTKPNIRDLSVFTGCCHDLLSRSELPGDEISMTLPDTIFRTAILDLESIPEERSDVHELIAWKLRDSTPFTIDDAVMSYSRIGTMNKLLVSLVAKTVLHQYEEVIEASGLHVGLIDQASFNCLNLLFEGGEPEESILVLNVEQRYFTIQIIENGYLLFYRCKHFPQQGVSETLVKELRATLIFAQERMQIVHSIKHLYFRHGNQRGGELLDLLQEELGLEVHRFELDQLIQVDPAIELDWEQQGALMPAIGVALGR